MTLNRREFVGTLGGVVVLLIWFYLTAFLLLLGAEINSVIGERARERSTASQTLATVPATSSAAGMARTLGFVMACALWVAALVGFLRRRPA